MHFFREFLAVKFRGLAGFLALDDRRPDRLKLRLMPQHAQCGPNDLLDEAAGAIT